jgi:Zn-dependent peptidase ImmA (M78 family)
VVRLSGVAATRLEAIEGGADPTVFETEALALLYGIDADVLADEPIKVPAGSLVHALASLDEFHLVGDVVRARLMAAALAGRDLVWLRKRLGEPNGHDRFVSDRPSLDPKPERLPALQGARLAAEVRRAWKLGQGPIPSVCELLAARLPSVAILYADFTADGPAGVSLVDATHGPAIVLNTAGKNENPLVRRFSLAHELCHLLVDYQRRAPLAQISGYLTESGLESEQRANGFAVRLLCPEAVLARLQRHRDANPNAMARELAKYGLHYGALRLYLHNVARTEVPATPPGEAILDPSAWSDRESPRGLSPYPLEGAPTERRAEVARLSALAYSRGLFGRGRFAELLGVSRAHPVERVLDHFGLDAPASDAA